MNATAASQKQYSSGRPVDDGEIGSRTNVTAATMLASYYVVGSENIATVLVVDY